MNNNISLLFAFSIICFSTIRLNAQMNYVGEYINEKGSKILVLKDDNTFFLRDSIDFGPLMPIWRLDTLSYGNWKYEENFIILNTPKAIKSKTMKMLVQEEYILGNDSLLITVSNPYERYYSKYGGKRLFRYFLYVDDYDRNFVENDYLEGNIARFYHPQGHGIDGVKLWIIPDSFLYPGNLAFNFLQTEHVMLKNREANVINIEIPDFTLEYISYERYYNEHIIIRNDKLIFRGDVFKERKDVSNFNTPRVEIAPPKFPAKQEKDMPCEN